MKKITVSDALFAVQTTGMGFFTIGQFVRMRESVQGVSPAWLLCALLFCAINLGLAYRGWYKGRGREASLLVITHAGWVVSLTALFALFFFKVPPMAWTPYDVRTLGGVLCAGIALLLVAGALGKKIGDPIIRGLLAAILRGVPHLALAYKVWRVGGGGIAALAVWTAHVTALVRIGQLATVIRRDGWDRSRAGIALAEGASEVTWAFVTVVWLAR